MNSKMDSSLSRAATFFPLYCAQQDEDTVVYHASKKVGASAVVIGFGGAKFWMNVPEQSFPDNSQYCYNVYCWNTDLFTNPTDWALAGAHCQDTPASYNDSIEFSYINNVNILGVVRNTYYFPSTGTLSCGFSDYGDAYYYYSFAVLC